jgi:hypothetical protein
MAHPSFQVWRFFFLGRYEIHFGKDSRGFFFYEIEDLETLAVVDVKDDLSEEEFLAAAGCALTPLEYSQFKELVQSIA